VTTLAAHLWVLTFCASFWLGVAVAVKAVLA
jgi:hypothetical protein